MNLFAVILAIITVIFIYGLTRPPRPITLNLTPEDFQEHHHGIAVLNDEAVNTPLGYVVLGAEWMSEYLGERYGNVSEDVLRYGHERN